MECVIILVLIPVAPSFFADFSEMARNSNIKFYRFIQSVELRVRAE